MSTSLLDVEGQSKTDRHSFFFYGTLCHPAILGRVLNRSVDKLQFQDALLPDHTRHHVKNEDYPALIDRKQYHNLRAHYSDPWSGIAKDERVGTKQEFSTNGKTGRGKEGGDVDWEMVDTAQRPHGQASEANCRGTLVHGLTFDDVLALDIFEGTEYTRQRMPVLPLSAPSRFSSNDSSDIARHLHAKSSISTADARRLAKEVEEQTRCSATAADTDKTNGNDEDDRGAEEKAWVYVWSDPVDKLEAEEWDFADFVRDKAHLWTGRATAEYDDVERHHAHAQARSDQPFSGLDVKVGAETEGQDDLSDGDGAEDIQSGSDPIGTAMLNKMHEKGQAEGVAAENMGGRGQVLGSKMEGFPDFGKNMRRYWSFDDKTINLNNGSYGAPPLPILAARASYADECERDPNRYMKRAYQPLLTKARKAVAELIGAEGNVDEVVLVPNASSGVQLVLREIDWEEGDVILVYNSTYGAIAQSVKYITDRHPHVSMLTIDLDLPITHESIIAATVKALTSLNKPSKPNYTGRPKATGLEVGKRARCLVLDHVASVPGIVFPVKQLVKLCKEYGVMSLVDAAHAVGQVEVDIKTIDPDFWISNCHKWLYTPRGCAVLYVPMRNQQLIRSSFPTGPGYESKRYPTQGMDRQWVFAQQYDWTGTVDWSSYLTIPDCIALRQKWGGEERIRTYCRDLAIQGGRRLAERWGTRIIGGEGDELTAAMVNVEMPSVPEPNDLTEQYQQLTYFEDVLLSKDVFCMTYRFAGRWWARFSAQIWCELTDFDAVADVLEEAIEGIKRGEHRKQDIDAEEESRELENALPK